MPEVIVKDKRTGIFYKCLPLPNRYKCGKCTRGVIFPRKGCECRICGCRVSQVLDGSGLYIQVGPIESTRHRGAVEGE